MNILMVLTESTHNPADYSVGMALFDLLPVIFFFLAGLILIRDLYPHLVKGNYALLAAGIIMIFMAGFFKALWKILVALDVCDWVALNKMFFPVQGLGFLFYGLALLGVLFKDRTQKASSIVLFPILLRVYDNNMMFIILQILGASLGLVMLGVIAIKDNRISKVQKIITVSLFVVAFITLMAMGALSSKLSGGSLEWVAEVINTTSQLTLLIGVVILHVNGVREEGSLDHLKKINI